MFRRILKLSLGIISLPVCVAASVSLYEQLNQIKTLPYNQVFFIYGVVAFLVVHILFFKPEYLYIVGHEVMHVLATWISGGRITSFRVSPKGGKVTATRSNLFIALAPYFFPFYTIVVAAAFFIVALFVKTQPYYTLFLFLIGFTLTFHIILTIDFLKIRQTDLLHAGYIFSVCLIYIVNLIVLGLIFSLLFEEVGFVEFFKAIYVKSKDIYVAIVTQLFL